MNRRLLISVLCVFSTLPASARQDHPTTGMAYNTQENSAISYYCTLRQPDRLECEINQSSIRYKTDEQSARTQIKEATKLPSAEELKKVQDEMCKAAKVIADTTSGNLQPSDPSEFKQVSQKSKAFMQKLKDSMQNFCQSPTSENSVAMTRLLVEQEKRTCKVFSYAIRQVFSKDIDGNWVVLPERSGLCDVVQLDRFEPEKASSVDMTFWNYFAKKAVNKNAKNSLCAGLDDKEYKYSWKSRPMEMACENIEFGL